MPAADAPDPGAPRRSGSTRSLPGLLLAIAVVLLALRIVATVIDSRAPAPAHDLIQWQPVAAADSLSRARHQAVLYDFSAAWCGPCRAMEREVFADERSAQMIQQQFVPVKVVDRQREDGRNPPDVAALQARYAINAFPTLVLVGPDGKVRDRIEGYVGRQALLSRLVQGSVNFKLSLPH